MIHSEPFTARDSAPFLTLFQQHTPLVHCLTNEVVQSFTANTLLALGASPAMVVEAEEAAEFSAIANALLINVGTLTQTRSEAMLAAIEAANAQQRPWVLDPVAVGALRFRTAFCRELLSLSPAAIRGNASEILALTQASAVGRGVDSLHSSDVAREAAQTLAQSCGAIVAVTGEVDYVTDGQRMLAVPGGDPLMTRVVGTGCALSAVVAAFCALPADRLQAVASACQVVSEAGKRAADAAAGPGSFIPHFLDALYQCQRQEAK